MSSPIAALPPTGSAGLPGVGYGSAGSAADLQVADLGRATQTPSANDLEAFGHALAASPARETQAAAPPVEGIATSLMREVEQVTQQMSSLQHAMQPGGMAPGGIETATPPNAAGPATLDRGGMNAAVGQMEHAYVLAIETTMASRGSTESTKIFNTLLKGQ